MATWNCTVFQQNKCLLIILNIIGSSYHNLTLLEVFICWAVVLSLACFCILSEEYLWCLFDDIAICILSVLQDQTTCSQRCNVVRSLSPKVPFWRSSPTWNWNATPFKQKLKNNKMKTVITKQNKQFNMHNLKLYCRYPGGGGGFGGRLKVWW